MTLTSKPNFKEIEARWQKFWQDKQIYKFDSRSKKPIYTIDTPPPYLSGPPHMGHVISYTGFEFVARYKRMTGFNVFFPIGFDDNGHPVERYVENKYKIKSSDTPRDKFIALCRKETEILEKQAKRDFTKLGHSYDWNLFYSTISPSAIKIAQQSFLDLYRKGLVYRSEEPGIWCVQCQTALSQADVEDKETETLLNYIQFTIADSNDKIQIATTRPELLPACVAIAVNPQDPRYTKLIGKFAIVPIFEQRVKIIADAKVEREFGTGAVIVCTFGDKTDIQWWRVHKLDTKIVLDKTGKLTSLAGKFAGFTTKKAREEILEELKQQKLLIKQEKLKQTIGVCWRCKNPIEFIITKQWAIKILENKKALLEQAKKIKWVPEYYIKRYIDWVQNLSWDWIISRQRHYGVPMPLWYCAKCETPIFADEKQLPVDPVKDAPPIKVCPKCKSSDIKPELDVFDTWMTSSLTPQIARGFTANSIPYDLRPQGYEIIRTWAFYTILKSLYHFKQIPWKHIMINGMILDPKGKAMHKSLGNVIEPMPLVEKYGADAMRYFASTVNIGEDAPFQEKELVRAQKLMIKLWNVAKFLEYWKVKPKKIEPINIIDNWIISRLSEIVRDYRKNFDAYNAVAARRLLENFFWHEYCDFYLEMIKYRLYGNYKAEKESAEQTLYTTFFKIIQLFAPFLPHITEELYQKLFKDYGKEISLHLTEIPHYEPIDTEALELGSIAMELISEIRKYKANKGLGPGAAIEMLTIKHPDPKAQKVLDEVAKTCRISHLHIEEGKLAIV
ncbi:MAG: valine--tRNA ligase [Candidatus Nanoarchaeia archaeon]